MLTVAALQFEKLFIINLPERFDKLDAFVLASSLTGFEFDVIEGVKGKDVSNKTLRTLEGLPKVCDDTKRPKNLDAEIVGRKRSIGITSSAVGGLT